MVKINYSTMFGSILLLAVLFVAGLEIANKVDMNMTGNIVLNPPIPATCSDASIIRTWESMFNEPAVREVSGQTRTVYTNLDRNCSVSSPCLPKTDASLVCLIPVGKNQTCQKVVSAPVGGVPVYSEFLPKRYCNSTTDCSGLPGASCRNAINPQKTCHRTSTQTGSYNQTLITIVKDTDTTRCRVYYAYKISSRYGNSGQPGTIIDPLSFYDVFLLRGKNDPYFNPPKEVIGIRGNFSGEFINELGTMTSERIYLYSFNSTNKELTYSNLRNRPRREEIIGPIGASDTFRATFKPSVDFGEWQINNVCYGKWVNTLFGKTVCRKMTGIQSEATQNIFTINDLDSTGKKSIKAEVTQNTSFEMLTYGEYETPVCTPEWVSHDSSCGTNDYQTRTYTDSNNCGETKASEQISCDYGNKKVVGQVSEIETENVGNLALKIDGTNFNSATDYSSYGIVEVQILESSEKLLAFDWDFSTPLELRSITIQKQDSNDEEGYLIVNGLEGSEKTFYVDKLTSENKVCVEDAAVDSSSDMSARCNEDNEYLVSCPGNKDQFDCSISGDKYVVSGLSNSGVEETDGVNNGGTDDDCTPSWSCGAWSTCSGGTQTRTCTDSESCGTTQNKPAVSQSCSIGCFSDWDCTDWSNMKDACGVRNCIDTKGCSVPTNQPTEEMTCPNINQPKPTWLIWLIVIVLVLLSIGVIATIIVLVVKNSKKK